MKLNQHQLNIVAHMNNPKSLIVVARAGSGKTTTIQEAIRNIPKGKSIVCLAFNRDIVNELKKRLPDHVDVKTIHAMGRAILNPSKDTSAKSGSRIRRIIKNYFDDVKPDINKWHLSSLVESSLTHGYFPDTYKKPYGVSLSEIAEKEDINLDSEETPSYKKHIDEILTYYIETVTEEKELDFDDFIYSVLAREFRPKFQYDFVFVDEAQDLSSLKMHILFKLLKPTGKFVAIGDPAQAIYEFAGAHTNSMSLIKEHLNCDELTIPVTQRCALAIVKEAQKLVPDIQAKENAPAGKVERMYKIDFWDMLKENSFDDNTMILCRNNAPLFELAFDFIKNNIPFHFYKIDELKSSYISKIKKADSENLTDVRRYHTDRLKKLDAQLTNLDPASTKYERIQEQRDQQQDFLQVLGTFMDTPHIRTTADMIEELNRLCSSENGIKLSTVHKSKGLEARTTIILREDLFKETDKNLLYVAITRSKEKLYYLDAA